MSANPSPAAPAPFGKRPGERSIEEILNLGIVIIDKPRGPSSHQVAEWTRNILSASKAGHLGTLDSNVSGVLPVMLGRATNAAAFLMRHDKEYVGIIRFDREISESEAKALFRKFTGEIWQTPPPGAAVARIRRKRTIHSLELLEMDGKDMLFKVKCEAGTYIRTLAEDMGKEAGEGKDANNAKLIELRRTRVGDFGEKEAITLQGLSDIHWLFKEKEEEEGLREAVRPLESVLGSFKKVWVSDNTVDALCSGAQLMLPGIKRFESGIVQGGTIAVMTSKDEIVAFAEAKLSGEEMKITGKGIAAKVARVIMERGTYSRKWKTGSSRRKPEGS